VLVSLQSDAHALVLTLQHAVADGWSLGVLVRELRALYAAFIAGKSDPLPALALQYADYAAWQRDPARWPLMQRQLDYWQHQLNALPPLSTLPTDPPRPPIQSFAGAWYRLTLPIELTEALRTLGHRHGATLFMTLGAAFSIALGRHAGQRDVA